MNLEEIKEKFEKSFNYYEDELKGLRVGRAKPSMVEMIEVDYYGNKTPLIQMASISAPEPRLIVIQPWDKNVIKEIEKAIQNSDLGVNPAVEGDIIRLNIPPLTEERRKEMVKLISRKAEEARQKIRGIRENEIKSLKKQKNEGEISEDEFYTKQEEIQKLVDEYNEKIKNLAEEKEKELLTI